MINSGRHADGTSKGIDKIPVSTRKKCLPCSVQQKRKLKKAMMYNKKSEINYNLFLN